MGNSAPKPQGGGALRDGRVGAALDFDLTAGCRRTGSDVNRATARKSGGRVSETSTPMNTSGTFVDPHQYHDAISARAREIWRERGEPQGEDVEIWLQAERELVERGAIPSAPPTDLPLRRRRVRDDINENELGDRLADFGEPAERSPTSVDVPRGS